MSGEKPKPLEPIFVIGCSLFGFILLLVVLFSMSPQTPTAMAPATPPPTVDATCNQPLATLAGDRIFASNLVRGSTDTSEGLIIMVNPLLWSQLRYSDQERMAAIIDCGIAGPGAHMRVIRFRYEQSGPDLTVFEAIDLLRLRQRGLAMIRTTEPTAAPARHRRRH